MRQYVGVYRYRWNQRYKRPHNHGYSTHNKITDFKAVEQVHPSPPTPTLHSAAQFYIYRAALPTSVCKQTNHSAASENDVPVMAQNHQAIHNTLYFLTKVKK
jgi:hypothetical protein